MIRSSCSRVSDMPVVTVTLLILFSGFLIVFWYVKYRKAAKTLTGIQGPSVLPIVGNALALSSATKALSSLMKFQQDYNGSNFKIFIGSQPYLFICNALDVESVLSSSVPIKKSAPYKFLYNWLGTGLLTSYGNKWRKHRKIITPAFHFKILEDFVDVFNSASEVFVAKLSQEVGKDSFDIYPYVTRCTLDIICETAMGTSVNAQDEYHSTYVEAVNRMVQLIAERAFSPLLQHNSIYRLTLTAMQERRDLKVLHGYTNDVIKRRRIELFSADSTPNGSNENLNTRTDDVGRKQKKAFLDLLLEYSLQDPSFTDENIREEVDTFMFEGHDTTATSITFALYSLAMNSTVQEKAFEELRKIFGDDPARRTSYRDLQEMKYLEMVIKESLRIYTTVPLYGRELTEDFDLNGVTLPKGILVTIFAYGVHHNSNYHKDPEKFDPERFTSENLLGKHPYIYIPFSAGPRNCIGQKFAMLEMKSTISHLLRNYKLLPAIPECKIQLRSDIVLKSNNGVTVKLEERKWA